MALVAGGTIASRRRDAPRPTRHMSYGQRARGFTGMFIFHFAAGGAAAFGASLYPSTAWAYVALGVFMSMCLGLLRTSPATFLLFVPLLTARLTEFLSGAAIESGAYMIETMMYGRATGAFTRLLLIYLLFFLSAAFVIELLWPRLRRAFASAPARWERQAHLIWIALLIVMLTSTAYLVRLGINNGFPLIDHLDRFVYMDTVSSPIFDGIMRNRPVVVPFIGVLFALPAYRRRATLMIVWLLALSMLFGEKFSSLVMILSFFAIPAGLTHIANDRPIPIKPIAGICAAIITITVPAVLVAYGALTNFDAAAQRYGQRVALQGQLWFVTDAKYMTAFRLDDRAIAADVASWVQPGEQVSTKAGTRFGLYYVMQPFTATRLLSWAIEGGNGFVFSLYPYLLMSLGAVGMLIVSSIIAFYHAVVMRLLAGALAEANWLASVALGRVMSSFYGTYSTGYLWNIFGVKTLLTLAAAVFLLWEGGRRQSVTRRMYARASGRIDQRLRA